MSTSDSDISAVMEHFDTAKANSEPKDIEGYSNCQKPVHKRKVKRVNMREGRTSRGHPEVKLKRVCPKCGDDIPRIRVKNIGGASGGKKINVLHNSNTGTIHFTDGRTALYGWSGGTEKRMQVEWREICGECRGQS